MKTTISHTPGPWKSDGIWHGGSKAIGGWPYINVTSLGHMIAHVMAWRSDDHHSRDEEAEANARLIAAAPDLLEACEGALSIMEHIWPLIKDRPDFQPKLRAAISKAKGLASSAVTQEDKDDQADGLYNCDQALWDSFHKARQAMPNSGARLRLIDGHVSDGVQLLARFKDNVHAKEVMTKSGLKEIEPNVFK